MTAVTSKIRGADGRLVQVDAKGPEIVMARRPFRPMSDAEVEPAALSAPDARPLSAEDSRRAMATPRTKVMRRALGLTQEEFAAAGPFAPLAAWLESHAARFGFFRPFRGATSGVAPEPWHFSFAPIAEFARRRLTPAVLREALESAPLLGKEQVLERLDELHARYVAAIDLP